MKKLIYVAGPYSGGNVNLNVRTALAVGDMIVEFGGIPQVPHLFHLWDMMMPKPYHHWLDLDMDYILKCDALYRMGGESPGADKEVAFAKEHGIPVIYDEADLEEFLQ